MSSIEHTSAMPKKQPCEELYALGKSFWIRDYACPELEDVFQTAQKVARIVQVDFSGPDKLYRIMNNAKIHAEYELAVSRLWFQLGIIFAVATIDIAADSERSGIPAKCGDPQDDISQPFPFMPYAMMCFSGGEGYKLFTVRPSPTEWRCCSNGKDEEHGNECVRLVTAAYNHALEVPQIDISIEEKIDRATSSNCKATEQVKADTKREIKYGIYEDPQGKLWIDGDKQKAYGDYGKNQRNERVHAAREVFPGASIHDRLHVMNWKLIG